MWLCFMLCLNCLAAPKGRQAKMVGCVGAHQQVLAQNLGKKGT